MTISKSDTPSDQRSVGYDARSGSCARVQADHRILPSSTRKDYMVRIILEELIEKNLAGLLRLAATMNHLDKQGV